MGCSMPRGGRKGKAVQRKELGGTWLLGRGDGLVSVERANDLNQGVLVVCHHSASTKEASIMETKVGDYRGGKDVGRAGTRVSQT